MSHRWFDPRLSPLAAGLGALGLLLLFLPRVEIIDARVNPGAPLLDRAWGSTTIGQTFRPTRDRLHAVIVSVGDGARPETEISFTLRSRGTQEVLVERAGALSQFRSRERNDIQFSFPPLRLPAGSPLEFTLAAPQTTEETSLPIRFDIASEMYPEGERLRSGRPRPGDLSFETRAEAYFAESLREHFLAGRAGPVVGGIVLAIILGVLLVDWRWRPAVSGHFWARRALLGCLLLALLYAFPLFSKLGAWAHDESDWPEIVSTLQAARASVLQGQFPGWNPYMCGGAPLFANPEPFLLVLPLLLSFPVGEVVALKVATPLVLALGLFGMLLLARTLGLRGPAALLPAIAYLFSGFTTTHLANGQFLWITLAWVPWILLGYLRALRTAWWALLSAAFIALTFVEGRLYIVAHAVILLSVLALIFSVRQRSWRPILILCLTGALTILGSAWKLLPALSFLSTVETSLPDTDGVPLTALDEAFFRRDVTPNVTDRYGEQAIPRHEYAAYLGLLPLLLALMSLHRLTRARALPFLLAAGVFLFLALQRADASPLELLPLFRELRNPSRMLSMVVFSVSLLAGFGLTYLRAMVSRRAGEGAGRFVSGLLVAIVTVDLLLVGWTHHARLFRFPPRPPPDVAGTFFQTGLPQGAQRNNGYPIVLAGKGAKDFCPTIIRAYRPRSDVRGREEPSYRGEIYSLGAAQAYLLEFTPNALTLRVDSPTADTIVVNQHYDRGWSAGPLPVSSVGTLLGVDVPNGERTVRLVYRPPFLGLGLLVTGLTIAGTAAAFWSRRSSDARKAPWRDVLRAWLNDRPSSKGPDFPSSG